MSPRFVVTARWSGEAEIVVDADDENRAEEQARDAWTGFLVAGGEINYEIVDVEEV